MYMNNGDVAMKLSELIRGSKYTVVLTGAGMSVAAGLPDFTCDSIGPFSMREFIQLDNVNAIYQNRNRFVELFSYCIKELQNYDPTIAHKILAKWEEEGLVKSIITQNVDCLHQKAGSKNVIEIHGTLGKLSCTTCGKEYMPSKYLNGETLCECGGFIRPSVTLFHEGLDTEVLDKAYKEIMKAELLIVLGSSLKVSPANQLPRLAKAKGAKLVIVNLDSTDIDGDCDLLISEKIDDVLIEANGELVKADDLRSK